jgi:hypothetical protein
MTGSNSVPEALTTYFDSIDNEDWDPWHYLVGPRRADPSGARPHTGADEIVEFHAERLAP